MSEPWTYGKNPLAKSMEGFVQALKIFAKHTKDGMAARYQLHAEHDILYAETTPFQVPEDSEDGKILDSLGWHVSEENDCWAYFF